MICHALLLAAGLGTRLRPLTDVRAKPAIPVGGEPMIRRIITWLSSSGVRDLVVNLHHLPQTITAAVGDGSDLGARVRYSWEARVLGTAGGPRQALPIIGAETFFVINGDTITDLDLRHIADSHARSGALVTLALVPNRDFERYGGVQIDGEDRVTGFVTRGPSARASWHFVGVQVAQASAFAPLGAGVHASSIGGVYDDLIRRSPGSVRAFRCDAAFHDVGTPADYWRTSQAFIAGDGRDVTVHPTARVRDSILWDRVDVGAHALVEQCIVTDDVRIAAGAEYRRSIIMREAGSHGLSVLPLSA